VISQTVFHMFSNDNFEYKLITYSEEETRRLGFLIGTYAYGGLCVLQYGDLGMGKTMLAQGIGSALGIKNIKSPTFVIIGEHDNARLPLIHVDLYRLDTDKEIDALDLENYIDQKCLLVVEWAEHWKNAPSEDCLCVRFALSGNDQFTREISMKSVGANAASMLKNMIETFK